MFMRGLQFVRDTRTIAHPDQHTHTTNTRKFSMCVLVMYGVLFMDSWVLEIL